MSTQAIYAVDALNQAFLRNHPESAQQAVNKLSIDDLVTLLQEQSAAEMLRLWNGLILDRASTVLQQLPETNTRQILQRGDPLQVSRVLMMLSEDERNRMMTLVDSTRKRELASLVLYPDESAGSLMDPRFLALDETLSVRDTLRRIRKFKPRFSRHLYLTDSQGKLLGMVEIYRLALSEAGELLVSLAQPVRGVVTATASRGEVIEQLEHHHITEIPVIDIDGRLIGVIHYDALMEAVRKESSVDMLTMVGASRDERALSKVSFVVRKRLPWLSINLLTAFLAAAVVGLFENTIASFTALAVLLPVVAGQSGNTGAQALAVTMRGLALREIGASQWLRVARKEVAAGIINGIAIALLTSLGVLLWSSSVGLALVIGSSMVIAMAAAAFSGVIIPVILTSLGQDPAQSSSIILTTVTDVVGFFAFLGIATMLISIL